MNIQRFALSLSRHALVMLKAFFVVPSGLLDCGEVLYKMDPGAHESQEAREKHAARLVRALMRLRQQEIRHDINFDGCLRFAGRGVRDQQFPSLRP